MVDDDKNYKKIEQDMRDLVYSLAASNEISLSFKNGEKECLQRCRSYAKRYLDNRELSTKWEYCLFATILYECSVQERIKYLISKQEIPVGTGERRCRIAVNWWLDRIKFESDEQKEKFSRLFYSHLVDCFKFKFSCWVGDSYESIATTRHSEVICVKDTLPKEACDADYCDLFIYKLARAVGLDEDAIPTGVIMEIDGEKDLITVIEDFRNYKLKYLNLSEYNEQGVKISPVEEISTWPKGSSDIYGKQPEGNAMKYES